MWFTAFRNPTSIGTERLILRLPQHSDWRSWAKLRQENATFLKPWEPSCSDDQLGHRAFANHVYWANRADAQKTALPLFLVRREDDNLLGAVTLDNIRKGPSQSAILGYWVGEQYTRQGYMTEAICTVVAHAFDILNLSRIEAACLPENNASRSVLEKTGFKYEGVAQSYLQINGRWRNHVVYAILRSDRRGRVDILAL